MPTRKKEQSQPRLKSIKIERLKCVKDLEMSLEGNNVTAILGRNGSGKSTVLQAIYCLYQPKKEQFEVYRKRHKINQFEEIPDSKFSHFFKHVDGRLWTESRLSAKVYWREETREINTTKYYKKSKRQWTPRMGFKPKREIYYIGINSCVPAIERVIKGKVTYRVNRTTELQHAEEIRTAACRIMGYHYDQLYYSNETKRLFFNVEKDENLIHALALGAGEQRLFAILETLYNADRYALITIDELDLTLHTAALLRLIDEMVRIADEKHLQIVFTTHRQEVMSRKDINVRYLMQTPEKTLCLDDPTDVCYEELIGTHEQDLTIWVEDRLSKAIVEKVIEEEEMSRRADVRIFGTIENAFTLAGYYKIADDDVSKLLIVADGDKYVSEEEKIRRLKHTIIGDRDVDVRAREEAMKVIRQYYSPNGYAPEKVIHQAICENGVDGDIKRVAMQIFNPDDKHGFVDEILEKMHWGREKYYRVIDVFAKCPQWVEYTQSVREWLKEKK